MKQYHSPFAYFVKYNIRRTYLAEHSEKKGYRGNLKHFTCPSFAFDCIQSWSGIWWHVRLSGENVTLSIFSSIWIVTRVTGVSTSNDESDQWVVTTIKKEWNSANTVHLHTKCLNCLWLCANGVLHNYARKRYLMPCEANWRKCKTFNVLIYLSRNPYHTRFNL